MVKTAIYRDNLFLKHRPGFGHVESPDRLSVIYQELDKINLQNIVFPSFEKASRNLLELNHTQNHIQKIADTANVEHGYLDPDTLTSMDSYDAACLAVGALTDGVERMVNNEFTNCFCLVRPPGHHAERNRAMGFCLFNNIAVAAYHAITNLNLNRILIVDWDLHHGNGTQNSFYESSKVFYISTHQYPYYPGSGAVGETGKGAGEGFTLNIPLRGGQGDLEFAGIFNTVIIPVARKYRPQLIMVSCGFDIYEGDPLGGMRVTPKGFSYMTRVLKSLASEVCDGRLLVTLEGGYNLNAMKEGSLAVLKELQLNEKSSPDQNDQNEYLDKDSEKELEKAGRVAAAEQSLIVAKKYWKV